MTIKQIQQQEWQNYFAEISLQVEGQNAELEIDSLDFGAHIQSNKLHIEGLTYDPKNNIFEVSSDDLEHVISAPEEIYVDIDEGMLESIKIEDNNQVTHILTFLPPLLLPLK